MTDLIIIGGGPAALSCALTARQRNLDCLVVCADANSGWLARAESLDNYPGMPHVSGRELLRVFRAQAEEAGASFMSGVARQIQPMGSEFMVLVGNDVLETKAVVLAMGAARPALLPGEEDLLGRGVSWCGTCDGMFYRGKRVAVLSAWNGGAEEAEFLAGLCASVDYYTLKPHDVPADERITQRSEKVRGLAAGEDRQITVETADGSVSYDGVFVFRPAVAPDRLLPGLALNGGFVSVDRRMATSVPLVYACGDCTGQPLQVAKAVGEGNVAAISASEDLARA
ncbi:MAG: NAD(P)/FAD-dependent oxidoreductase [Clostridia bacterium]|nr:NAD(P)/FAD-dependent oxidoreductase [Clostridia bacterium]